MSQSGGSKRSIFRVAWSSRTLAVVVSLMFLAIFDGCKKEEPKKPQEVRDYAKAAYVLPEATKEDSQIKFTDITAASGVNFVHHNGAFGKKWMPETMGSGGGFFDYNGDGWADIFLVNSCDWPGHEKGGTKPTMKLFRNRGDSTFEDVTVTAKLDVTFYGMGCTFGDYDNDDDPDIYVTGVGGSHLYRNDSGVFVDVTDPAGYIDGHDPLNPVTPWSTSATWFDYNRDGRLDLYVCNYVKWSPATDLFTTRDGKTKSYATPQQYQGQSGRLYKNVDGAKFEDVTVAAGMAIDGKSLGVVAADFNEDGWPDLFVANDTVANFLFMNNGNGTFKEVGSAAGCGYDDAGRARAGMGVDVTDPQNDGKLAIGIGNFSGEPVSLYSQIEPGLFQDIAGPMRLTRPTLPCLTFGVLFSDLDLDGYQDLVLANGHIEPEINAVEKEVTFAQRPQVFRNNGKGEYIDVTDSAGEAFNVPIVGRGLAAADFDHDGDEDVLITVNGGPAKLLRNDSHNPSDKNWIAFQVESPGDWTKRGGEFFIGNLLEIKCADTLQRRVIRASNSYLTQSSSAIIFGLGECEVVNGVKLLGTNYAQLSDPEAGGYELRAGCIYKVQFSLRGVIFVDFVPINPDCLK